MAPPLCNVIEPISAALPRISVPQEPFKIWRNSSTDLRFLGSEHAIAIERLLLGLDLDARRARFGRASSDASIKAHVREALSNATRVIGVFVDRELRGLLEIDVGQASGPAAVALVVEDGWRRRGLGWQLTQAAMQWAEETHAGPLRLTFSRHNWPMRQLCTKASAQFDLVLDEICADIACEKRVSLNHR